MSGLVDATGRPISTARMVPGASRDAGAFRDPISGWHGPQVHSPQAAARERTVMQRRAGDLAANDWAAGSALDAISMNAVGTGLLPKATIPADMLGISAEEASAIGKRMEWAWSRWVLESDVRGMCHFHDLQLLGIRSMLAQGELLHLALMLDERERHSLGRLFSFALQAVRPQRLQTPADMQTDPAVRDGVRMSSFGRPEGYYIANPAASPLDAVCNTEALTSADFSYIPTRAAHRRLVFHLFRHETEEQVRGVTTFAKGISLFRNLSAALNYELFAQVIAATFPVFIATESGQPPLPQAGDEDESEGAERYHEVRPGGVYYGDLNQKPYPLESKRPSANFTSFVEIILRAMAASQGIPYETLAKDYSKTNYSSMRAALNEAWKLYNYYRQWFARSYCQPIWEMVMEEAVLRGYVSLPSSAPDFYAARELWCNASWIGPARGFVDPVKEIQAVVMALQHNLMTYGEAWGERGGDWDEGSDTILHEAPKLRRIVEAKPAQNPVTATGRNGIAPESAQADEEEKA